MLEAIKRLKEELISRHVNDHGLATGEGMRWLRNCELTPDEVLSLIDRAIRIASEHHLRKVEEDFVKVVKEAAEHPTEPEASDEYRAGHSRACDASRQAHEDLIGEVKTE